MVDDWATFGRQVALGIGIAVAAGLVIHGLLRLASRRLEWARALVDVAHRPFWALLLLAGLWYGAAPSVTARSWWPEASQVFTIATIGAVSWFLVSLVTYVTDLTLGRSRTRTAAPNAPLARKLRTQTLILRRLLTAAIIVMAVGATLFTFDAVRALGTSILASAGILSVVAGLAAQSVLANMFAGIQLVFSNALRVDDVIVSEGEWGRVEEITLSYVVLRLWDDRRLVLPCTYFTSTPYQNWTRQGSELLGSVEFDLDWRLSPHRMREYLKEILAQTPLFDGRTAVLQVTDATGGTIRIRILVTAHDAPTLWDLRCYIREAMVLWVQKEMPDAAPAQRIVMSGHGFGADAGGASGAHAGGDAAPAKAGAGRGARAGGGAEAAKPGAKRGAKAGASGKTGADAASAKVGRGAKASVEGASGSVDAETRAANGPELPPNEGLFTGSIQAIHRASLFIHGDRSETNEDDPADPDARAWEHETVRLDPVRRD